MTSSSKLQNTPLCLACASSLPPRLPADKTFRTRCCGRPICPGCLESRPRLANYDPCLACLSGVGATSSSGAATKAPSPPPLAQAEELFSIGDEDDAEPERDPEDAADAAPPPYDASAAAPPDLAPEHAAAPPPAPPAAPVDPAAAPAKRLYHLKPHDTLAGLALRFGVSTRALCVANGLPPAAARASPHLLHTRTSVLVPPPAGALSGLTTLVFDAADADPAEDEDPAERRAREARRARERAAVRLQTLTKEQDGLVARAYVALADDADADEQIARAAKMKEAGRPLAGAAGLEGSAVDAYLEDAEWEAEMRARGVAPGAAKGKASERGTRWTAKVW
jgi:hypothetical protein